MKVRSGSTQDSLNQRQSLVSVAVYGGLGNQLFQYAVGRALAERNSSKLQLDLRHFESKRAFSYGLDNFNIDAVVGNDRSLPPSKQDRLRYLAWRYLSKNPQMVREKNLSFDPTILEAKGSLYLQGYWQSYRYFAEISEQIGRELTWVNPPSDLNESMLNRIRSGPSIALHVRRGDYVTNPQANQFHGTCPPHYYRIGVQQIIEQIQCKPTVFVFSDDLQWAVENIHTDCESVFVSHNDSRAAHEDLRLMSACQHQVISNSTFSWWAAWLNRNPQKLVVAPARWFAASKARNEDLIPENWIRIDHTKAIHHLNGKVAA